LVNAVSRQGGEHALPALLQGALSPIAASQAASVAVPRHGERKSRQQTDKPDPGAARHVEAGSYGGTPHAEGLEEEGGHPEGEVQPLFDPKLPPSANSNFKPTIGLVGTSADEFDELQQLYPQLQLQIVQAEAIRSADVFRHCQRVIGLREEVASATDEFLRRALRNRYVRLSGGIAQVREQLDAWLNQPGSINAGYGKGPMRRNPKGARDLAGKKRHNRRPRPPR
jgi:hypothetical protein